jgi:hypothetical protein
MMLALDYPRPVGAAQLPAGVGVLRYWPKQGGSRVVVGLGRAEITDLTDNKRPFTTIYEAPAATWMAGGYGAGQQAGRWLAAQFEASGHTPRAVYLAADDNGLSTASVNACLDGAASVLGRGVVGLYGYLPQLRAAYEGGHASWWWLTGRYVEPAAYPWIHVYQCQGSQPAGVPTTIVAGGQKADVNMILRPDWGQSNGEGGGWLMALTDAQQQQLYTWVKDLTTVFGEYYSLRRDNVGDQDDHTIGAAVYDIEAVLSDAYAATKGVEGGEGVSIGAQVAALYKAAGALAVRVDALTTQLAELFGQGVTLGATGQITVGPVATGTGGKS